MVTERTAVNQGPGCGDDYPFTEPSTASRLFLDFYLSFADTGCGRPRPFRLHAAMGFGTGASASGSEGGEHARDIVLTDADGEVVINTADPAVSYVEQEWDDTRTISQWTGSAFVVRCVWMSDFVDEFNEYQVFDAPLDDVTLNRTPRRLTSITVDSETLTGEIEFVNGYNTDIAVGATQSTDGGQVVTPFTFTATPGGGIGAFPGCTEENVPLARINGVAPLPGGNFIFDTEQCHRLRQPGNLVDTTFIIESDGLTQAEAEAAWQFVNDCESCRRCEEFEAVAAAARRVYDGFWEAGQAAQEVAELYGDNRERWLAQKECRRQHAAKLAVLPQAECRTAVSAVFCNTTACCLFPVELRFTFRRFTNGALAAAGTGGAYDAFVEVSSGDGEESYAVEGEWPVFRVHVPNVDAQGSVTVRFRTCGECSADDSFEVTMSVHADDPGVDENGNPCDLPVVEISSEIQDVWDAAGIVDEIAVSAVTTKTVPADPSAASFNCGCG